MSNKTIERSFTLSSGNSSQLLKVDKPLISNYFILIFPKQQGEPSFEEVSELLQLVK